MLVQLKLCHTISIHFTSRQIDVEIILQVNLVSHHLLLM
uniref:Uncharacterized protein n=1 Tax=virus sp. ctx9V1 TaxID=2828001 RepID=A0A8S5RCU2_9VIRU|nr:MAG TPA: hypothetical protein [virus sp. ctx9V1]